jgi:hypothetical protein
MHPAIIFGLMLALVAAIVWGCIWAVKKDRELKQAVARELKLQFLPQGDPQLFPLITNLPFFQSGGDRKITNLIQGKISRQGKSIFVAIFDYQYWRGRGDTTFVDANELGVSFSSEKRGELQYQTVLFFYDQSLDLPEFRLRPEHIVDKAGSLLGFQDLNFEQFPQFSKRYHLQTQQVAAVKELFQPNLIKCYEGLKDRIATEAKGPYLVVIPSTDGRHSQEVLVGGTSIASRGLAADEIKPYLNLGLRLIELLASNNNV